MQIEDLDVVDQSVCVFAAAELAVDVWSSYEEERFGSAIGVALMIECEAVHDGQGDLGRISQAYEQLRPMLPSNLPDVFGEQLRAGLAGWSIYLTGMITLDDGGEVTDSLVGTGIGYGLRVGSGVAPVWPDVKVTDVERDTPGVVNRWWQTCISRVAGLRNTSTQEDAGTPGHERTLSALLGKQ